MNKPVSVLSLLILSLHSFGQIVYSIFPDPTGKYSTTASGICFSCSISNASNVADNDFSNSATIIVSAGVGASRGIRAKLPSVVPGNTKAGFYINVGSAVSSLPSVTLTTYKSGSARETILSSANIVTLLGGSEGFVCASTSSSLDYDEVGISFNGGALTVGLSADVFYAFGGGSTCPVVILPVKWIDISVRNNNDIPIIIWKAENENDVIYHLQRSYDGISFTTIYIQNSLTGKSRSNFVFQDKEASAKIVYYRVEAVNKNSSVSFFSKTAIYQHKADLLHNGAMLYPNPLQGNSFVIAIPFAGRTSYKLQIIDASGRIADMPSLNTDGQFLKATLHKKLPAGIYSVRLLDVGNKQSTYGRMIIMQ